MKRGNPNWGKPELLSMATPTLTEFEQTVLKLNLKPDQYVTSVQLREWAEQNGHSKYVPESLLRAWGIKVQVAV
jgi:hypothetical protein